MAEPRETDELLAAYLDGVSELTPEERKRVEARLSELDVEGTRGMIDRAARAAARGRTSPTGARWRSRSRRRSTR